MPDLRERLNDVDRLSAPDLWDSIETRLGSRQDKVVDLRSVREVDDRSTLTRALTIAAAFLIAGLAFGWIFRSLIGSERPAATPTPVVAPTSVRFQQAHGRITYLQTDGRLMAADPDPGSVTITTIAQDADAPIAWSRDGQRLLLANGMVVDSDGSVVEIAAKHTFQGGSFSPDGSRVVYSDGTSLFIADVRGGSRPLITSYDLRRYGGVLASSSPAWSPDGSRIAYVARTGCCAPSGVGAGYWLIRSIAVDGTDDRTLVDKGLPNTRAINTAAVESLTWSPDGSKLVFSITPNADGGQSSIWVYTRGSSLQPLTSWDGSSSPTWSSDGTRIAFTQGGVLKTMRADGSAIREIAGVAPASPFVSWNPLSRGA